MFRYGIDAPYVALSLLIFPALAVLALAAADWSGVIEMGDALPFFVLGAAVPFAGGLYMVLSSVVGKLWMRDKLIAGLDLTPDSQVLDVGCGRGLGAIGAAKLLPHGRVVGLDVWHGSDLSGNGPQAVLENAAAEGVADRVETVTGDARALPFPDATFDAVISLTAIHNIPGEGGRQQAITEMVRVLKPDGRLGLFDIRRADEYAQLLRDLGIEPTRSSLWMLWGLPGHILWARKPSGR